MPSILRYLTEPTYLHYYQVWFEKSTIIARLRQPGKPEQSVPYLVYITLYLTEPREKFP